MTFNELLPILRRCRRFDRMHIIPNMRLRARLDAYQALCEFWGDQRSPDEWDFLRTPEDLAYEQMRHNLL